MWCSVADMFLMYEQINEDVEWNNFRQNFHRLFKEGLFFSKPNVGNRKLYLRKSNKSKGGN